MKFKEIENGYADVSEKYFIYEFDEKWNVYKDKGHNAIEFVWKFDTLEEAKEFVKSKL